MLYHPKKVIQFDKEHNEINRFKSVYWASKETGISEQKIRRTCQKKQKEADGFIFEYIEEEKSIKENKPKRIKIIKEEKIEIDKPFKCPYCDRRFISYNGLCKHVIKEKTHGEITREQLLTDYKYGGVRPKCKCGCEEYTNISYEGGAHFVDFVKGHHSRICNNWGHNPDALSKSFDTKRRLFAEGKLVQWNKGKKWTETYSPEKVKELYERTYTKERAKKISEALKGKPKSPEHKEKMIRRMMENESNFKMSSKEELEFIETMIKPLGYEFIHQYFIPEISQFVDVYIEELNLAIEFDGDFYHCNPELYPDGATYQMQKDKIEKDKIKNKYFEDNNIPYLRIWEYDYLNRNDKVKELINEAINFAKEKISILNEQTGNN